jgi:hypothetical protein
MTSAGRNARAARYGVWFIALLGSLLMPETIHADELSIIERQSVYVRK